MIDTSALVASLIAEHQFHDVARRNVTPATRVPSIVLAETFSQLRRTFGQPAEVAQETLSGWTSHTSRVLVTNAQSVKLVFARAVELDLGGNIHDALVAQTCIDHGVPLVTLDRRQHRVALALGADSTYLLA